jgi:AcrR family transcriptional regulator
MFILMVALYNRGMEAKIQRQQALSDARRGLVMDAARRVFAEMGIEGASIREIAKRAGYTPGAIYTYFSSKELIYAALLDESLDRLKVHVDRARPARSDGVRLLLAKAQAWFDFYVNHPRDLDLGFYLVHGLQPRGLTDELNARLNDKLYAALEPCEEALRELGCSPDEARRENTALFAHGVGLLLLHHTGRIRLFGQLAPDLFGDYVRQLAARRGAAVIADNGGLGDGVPDSVDSRQSDLFGL